MKRLIVISVVLWLFVWANNNAWGISTLYMVQDGQGQGDLLLKYESGNLTTVGNIGFNDVRGLAYDATSGKLFGVSRWSDCLITINQGTGAGTAVGGNPYLPEGSNTAEISARIDGTLFGTGHLYDETAVDTLLSVDKATGIATPISIGGFEPENSMAGLAFDHHTGTLYGSSYGGELYTIDQSSGAATLLGYITDTIGNAARIAFDQADGILYGITTSNQLVTIDLPSLVGTEVAQFPTSPQIYAIDFESQVPEPATICLLGLGALSLLRSRKRKV